MIPPATPFDDIASPSPATVLESVRQLAEEWCRNDPNPTTSAYVHSLLRAGGDFDDDDIQGLRRLFPSNNERISFGTSGLRGRFQPGPLGMNDLTVLQTAQGLARYLELQQQQQNDGIPLRVVIGYDHRAHPLFQLSSLQFALLTALVFLQAGWKSENVIVLDGFLPTPLVPFACQHLSAILGIMITASHNPAQDAGYKIYYGACQIQSPRDAEIQSCIDDNLEPWTDYGKLCRSAQGKHAQTTDYSNNSHCWGMSDPIRTKEIVDAYFTALAQSGLVTGQAAKLQAAATTNLPLIVYTAMHGVAYQLAKRSFTETFGLPSFASVPQQQDPDPSFSTVAFPNPEERGALNLAKEFGLSLQGQSGEQQRNIVILANDPDGDRLAVAEYNAQDQFWTTFTGDQIGVLLGHWLWTQIGARSEKPLAMCLSTVSSKMLSEIGRVEGFRVEETLTGFKWIGNRAKKLHDEGYNVLLAYEESIGYCCGNVVFDKDGISALGVLGELTLAVYGGGGGQGQLQVPPASLAQRLQTLYEKYGEFVSHNGYYYYEDPNVVDRVLNKIRNNGQYDLHQVGQYQVASIRDLGVPGYDSTTADHRPLLPTSRSSPMITIHFVNGGVAQFRSSGTEPKFKYYLELKGAPGTPRHTVTQELKIMADTILQELLEPTKNGLVAPK